MPTGKGSISSAAPAKLTTQVARARGVRVPALLKCTGQHMHRFIEATPTTLIGKDLIHVVVASWEIQRGCSPLPTIGHPSTWVLTFVIDPTSAETGPDVGKGHGA